MKGDTVQIHYAAKRGDRAAVERQMARGISINTWDESEGETPLTWAARSSKADPAFLHFLIEQGAEVNAVSSSLETTPLFEAVRAASLEKVICLLEAGANVHYRNHNGYSALIGGAPSTLEITRLLEQGTQPDGVTPWGESALSVASRESDWPVVRLLLEFGADPVPLEWTPLMQAVALGTMEEVQAELYRGGDLSARDRWERTPWLLAVCAGDRAKAEVLAAKGAEMGATGRGGDTALMYAAKRNDVPMLEWLLSQGADAREATNFGDTALHEAAGQGAADACRVLLTAGADVQAETQTADQPISEAATVEIAHLLIKAGADVNFVSGQGIWPLLRAASEGDTDMVRALLTWGAAVETTSTGETALMGAVKADELGIMRLLLNAGADPNAQDVDGWGMLWFARTTEAVRILLDAGADVHLVDEMGREALQGHADTEIQAQLIAAGCFVNPPETTYGTPLIAAADNGHLEQILFLLDQGTDIDAATGWGKTALMEAAEHGFAAGVQALLAAGADPHRRDDKGRAALVYAAAPEALDAYQVYVKTRRWVEEDRLGSLSDFVDTELLQQVEEIVGPWQPDPIHYGYVASDSLEALDLLAQAGSDLNACDADGRTPLMLTAAWGRLSRIAGLLDLGAETAIRDAEGKTALDHAQTRTDDEQRTVILRLLTERT